MIGRPQNTTKFAGSTSSNRRRTRLKLTQVDLSDAQMIKSLLEHLEILDELSGQYPKINDLRIDLLRKVQWADLEERVLRLIFEKLVNNKGYRQLSSEMKVSPRWARKSIDAA